MASRRYCSYRHDLHYHFLSQLTDEALFDNMKRTKDTPSSSIPRITRSKAAYSNATRIVSAEFLEEDTSSEQVTPNIPTRPTEQDAIESSSQHLGDDSSIAEKEKGLTSEPRRTRGPTRCKDIWTLSEGEKISIGTNDFGQPVSERTSNLSHFLGTMIRQRGLLNGTDWRLVNKTIKDDMWEDVKRRFEFDDDCKDWVLKSLAKKRRAWKTRVKSNYFDCFESDENRISACHDNRIDSDQLKDALEFWNSEKGQAISERNKASRAQQKISHTSGTRSFARVRELERKKMPNGEDPPRAHIFMVTHTRKDGNPVDEPSAEIMSKIQELYSQQPEDSQMMEKVSRDDIFSKVMGEDGRSWVRTIGMGPTPSKVFGDKGNLFATRERVSSNTEEVRKMRDEMKVMHNTMEILGRCVMTVLKNGGESTSNVNINDMLGALNIPMPNTQDPNPANDIHDIGSPHEHLSSRASNIDRNCERFSMVAPRGKDPQASNHRNVEEVFLKSWIEADLVVGSGIVVSRESNKIVGGVELGDYFCEVSIEIPIQPLAPLIRPYGNLKTIGDAVGRTIAWLRTHVERKGA